ncbi:hypothetical protein GYMLUDRAFT_164353, partial [Collybiopsis luxurians FD-317 M1]
MGPHILIIDGLDECYNNHNEWSHILSILARMLQKLSLPIKLLVCSRPEPCIKEWFGGSEFKSGCQWMPLDDRYWATKDIRVFLLDGFQRILIHHSHSMVHVPRPWPTFPQIEYLLQKSSTQFIYAATVPKYVDHDGDVPADRLNIILNLPVKDYEGRDSPYAQLDALYLQILSAVQMQTLLLQVLAARIIFQQQHNGYQIKFLHLLCGIPAGTLHAISSGVHSLFKDPSPVDSGFDFAHASFPEFLLDHNRSLHFH